MADEEQVQVTVQILPVCFRCGGIMDADLPVFYAPTLCEHHDCPSACWHLSCLVEHREELAALTAEMEKAQHTHQTPGRLLRFRKYTDG